MTLKPDSERSRRQSKSSLALLLLVAGGLSWLALRQDNAGHGTAFLVARLTSTEPAATSPALTTRATASAPTENEAEPSQTGLPISGVVVDAAGGSIAGARLEAREDALIEPWVVAGESRADGKFELHVPAGAASLRTNADGYAVSRQAIASPDRALRIQLAPAARIAGQVVNALDGHPLFGIEVNATSPLTLLATASDGVAVSDHLGRFVIDGLPAGSYRIIARSPQWFGQTAKDVTVRIGDSASDIRLLLHPAVSVRGRVLVAPKAEACSSGLAFLSSEAAPNFANTVAIGAGGTVEFTGVPAGSYRVELQCQDGFAAAEIPPVHVGTTDLDLVWTLQTGGRVVGRVVDRQGRGLARAIGASGVSDFDNNRMPFRVARSSEHGDFELAGLGAGRYRIALTDAPDVHQDLDVVVGAHAATVTLQVRNGASLRVQLTGADERSLDAFSVTVARRAAARQVANELEARTAQCTGPGLFVINDLPEGTYDLSADDGHNPYVTRSVSLLADQTLNLSWPMPLRDAALEGRVLDAKGEPVSDAWVRVTNGAALNDLDAAHAVLTQLDGRFSLPHLDRSATYDIQAQRPPHASVVMRSIKPGQLAVLTLPAEQD